MPHVGVDPDGEFVHILASMAVGAAVGAGVGLGVDYLNDGKIDDGYWWKGAIIGGVAGGAFGATFLESSWSYGAQGGLGYKSFGKRFDGIGWNSFSRKTGNYISNLDPFSINLSISKIGPSANQMAMYNSFRAFSSGIAKNLGAINVPARVFDPSILQSINPINIPWIDVGLNELMQSSIPGELHNPRVVDYFNSTTFQPGNDDFAWCSAYCNWVFNEAGFRGPNSARARDG